MKINITRQHLKCGHNWTKKYDDGLGGHQNEYAYTMRKAECQRCLSNLSGVNEADTKRSNDQADDVSEMLDEVMYQAYSVDKLALNEILNYCNRVCEALDASRWERQKAFNSLEDEHGEAWKIE